MLGFHIYVGFMEGNPCFFRINACFTTFCDPITSGCQGFQEWIALYSTSNKLVQAQTRASTNEDEIGYQSQKASPLLDWKASSFKNNLSEIKKAKDPIDLPGTLCFCSGSIHLFLSCCFLAPLLLRAWGNRVGHRESINPEFQQPFLQRSSPG